MGLFGIFAPKRNNFPKWEDSSSLLTKRAGSKYRQIIDYFAQHPWGSVNHDMKIINTLPHPDRTIIVEEVMKKTAYTSIDKITYSITCAYFWVGYAYYNDFLRWSRPFADACYNVHLISEQQHDCLIDKIRELALTPTMNSYISYSYARGTLEDYAPDCELRNLAINLCRSESENGIMIPFSSVTPEPVRHPNYNQDKSDFEADRNLFLSGLK